MSGVLIFSSPRRDVLQMCAISLDKDSLLTMSSMVVTFRVNGSLVNKSPNTSIDGILSFMFMYIEDRS